MAFETKDSGKREEFESGMVRDTNEGKILWHLVASGPMLQRWAEQLTRGAVKYEQNNWLKAEGKAELQRFKESAFRHFMQWYLGETDEDHGAAVFFNINGAEYVRNKTTVPDLRLQVEYSPSKSIELCPTCRCGTRRSSECHRPQLRS